ncbi:MAG: SprB repeat-containing protein, partial [Flavipsychrobacter sp.]|nr:SprB repeat-containing protein [Flavipsychrobacter sp.]
MRNIIVIFLRQFCTAVENGATMKHILFTILLLLGASVTPGFSQAIYTYTSATNGAPSSVAANTTYTNLTAIGTGSNTPCGQGFSGITGFTGGSYNPAGPCVSVTVRPNSCYKLSITGFHAGLRRSGTGPVSARLAYSIDGGLSWVDMGTNVAPNNAGCATSSAGVANATWNTNVTVTSSTLGVIFRIYPFGASGSTGTMQIWGLNIYGTVDACAPTLSTSITPVTCNGGNNGSINLNVSNGCNPFTYSWTGPGGFTATSQNITGLVAGTYSVTVSAPGGCAASTTAQVTQPAPVATQATNNGPLCSGGTLTLSATNVTNASFSWSGPNSFSANTQNASIANVSTAAAGVYTVTATVNGCTATDTTHVTISPTPQATLGSFSDPTTCLGTDGFITLTGLPANTNLVVTYLLNGTPQSSSVSSDGSGDVLLSGLAAGVYDNIIVVAGSCSSAALGPVTLSDPPTPPAPVATANSPVCSGNDLNLFASFQPGVAYSWTGPGSFTSGLQNPVIPSAPITASGIYEVTATANGCVSLPGSVSVTVKPTPAITGVQFTGPTTCNGTDGAIVLYGLQPNTSFSVSYQWNSIVQPTVTLLSDGSGVLAITGLAQGQYEAIVVNLNGCADTASGPVVLADPVTPVITAAGNSPLCEGETLQLSATPVTNATYSWTGPNNFTSAQQDTAISNVTSNLSGTYSVVATVNGCVSAPAQVSVIVSPMPVQPVVTSNGPICAGNDLELYTASQSGVTYNWTGPNGFTSGLQNPV